MDLPRHVAIEGIKPSKSTVYHFKNSTYEESAPAHIHIAIPVNDSTYVLLTMITSQVTKRKEFYAHNAKALESVIEITSNELDFIKKASVIDCNKPLYQTKEELDSIISGDITFIDASLSDDLIERIRAGIINSPLVKPVVKKLLT